MPLLTAWPYDFLNPSSMESPAARLPQGNIGPSEQRKRLVFGILALAAAMGWVTTGRASSFSGAIIPFVLFWFGTLGILQAREKT